MWDSPSCSPSSSTFCKPILLCWWLSGVWEALSFQERFFPVSRRWESSPAYWADRVLGRLREFSLPVILACTGIAQLIVYFSGSAAPLFFAAGLIGFFFSIRMPSGYLKATASVTPAAATLAISVYCSSSQVGQFLSPPAVNSLSELLSLTLEQKFLLGGFCLLGAAHDIGGVGAALPGQKSGRKHPVDKNPQTVFPLASPFGKYKRKSADNQRPGQVMVFHKSLL